MILNPITTSDDLPLLHRIYGHDAKIKQSSPSEDIHRGIDFYVDGVPIALRWRHVFASDKADFTLKTKLYKSDQVTDIPKLKYTPFYVLVLKVHRDLFRGTHWFVLDVWWMLRCGVLPMYLERERQINQKQGHEFISIPVSVLFQYQIPIRWESSWFGPSSGWAKNRQFDAIWKGYKCNIIGDHQNTSSAQT